MEFLTDFLVRIPHGIGRDLSRYLVLAVGVWFVLWVLLARLLKHRKIRATWPPREQMVMEFFHSLRSITIFSVLTTIPWLLWKLELLWWVELDLIPTGPWFFWGNVLAMIIAHDAYFYWMHRLIHHPKRFRLYHQRHHRSNNPSPFTAYSFDLREAALEVMFVVAWEVVIPNPDGSVIVFVLIQLLKNTLAHSGFELMPANKDGRPMFDWFTTTVHHDLHHARAGYNFGLYFTWWDKWMGTEDPIYYPEFKRVVEQRKKAHEMYDEEPPLVPAE